MRSLQFILLISAIELSVSSLSLFAQSYLHEPTIWKQFLHTSSFPTIIEEDYTLELKGDTVINSKTYFKVLKSGIRTETNWYGGGPIETPIYEYVSPIREEDQKFYRYNINLQKEFLLHDFDLSVGDKAYVSGDDCDHNTVAWIDTIYIGNTPRKHFHFFGSQYVTLIEGVGSTRGLESTPCNDFPSPLFLLCYVQDQSYLQLNQQFYPDVDCSSLIVVSTEDVSDNHFTLFPNPFSDEINIQIPSVKNQQLNIVVTNLLGTIMYQKQIAVSNEIETINPGNIPPGLYVVWLSSKDATSSFKILKL